MFPEEAASRISQQYFCSTYTKVVNRQIMLQNKHVTRSKGTILHEHTMTHTMHKHACLILTWTDSAATALQLSAPLICKEHTAIMYVPFPVLPHTPNREVQSTMPYVWWSKWHRTAFCLRTLFFPCQHHSTKASNSSGEVWTYSVTVFRNSILQHSYIYKTERVGGGEAPHIWYLGYILHEVLHLWREGPWYTLDKQTVWMETSSDLLATLSFLCQDTFTFLVSVTVHSGYRFKQGVTPQ